MSADNGIYVLKLKDQYRVIEAQAIDNIGWSFLTFTEGREIVPTRLVEYYGTSKYTRNFDMAMRIATLMLKHSPVCEYGIQIIKCDKTWDQVVREAKELAPMEIKSIEEASCDGRGVWDYDLRKLKEFMEVSA